MMTSKNEKLMLELRNKINAVDEKILTLLAERRNLSIEIGKIKLYLNFQIRNINREYELMKRLIHLCEVYHLDANYIIHLFQIIIKNSILTQKVFAKKNSNEINSY